MQKFLKNALLIAAIAASGAASAAVITFDGLAESPLAPFMLDGFLGHNEEFYQSGMWIDPWSTKPGTQNHDLIGALVNGSDPTNDINILPSNNSSTFYTALFDSQLYLGNVDGSKFKMASFDASFVAMKDDVIPSLALILRVDGYLGSTKLATQDFLLPGPVANAYSFSAYAFDAAFKSAEIDQVVFYGYNCDAAGSCGRNSNRAQFALDNINVTNVTAVPEPSTWLLMGLGLAAVGSIARRRRAA